MPKKKLRVEQTGMAITDVGGMAKAETHEARMAGIEKALAKDGKRVVAMTDVTVTKEKLTNAVKKANKIPGNEIPAFVEMLLKEIIMA